MKLARTYVVQVEGKVVGTFQLDDALATLHTIREQLASKLFIDAPSVASQAPDGETYLLESEEMLRKALALADFTVIIPVLDPIPVEQDTPSGAESSPVDGPQHVQTSSESGTDESESSAEESMQANEWKPSLLQTFENAFETKKQMASFVMFASPKKCRLRKAGYSGDFIKLGKQTEVSLEEALRLEEHVLSSMPPPDVAMALFLLGCKPKRLRRCGLVRMGDLLLDARKRGVHHHMMHHRHGRGGPGRFGPGPGRFGRGRGRGRGARHGHPHHHPHGDHHHHRGHGMHGPQGSHEFGPPHHCHPFGPTPPGPNHFGPPHGPNHFGLPPHGPPFAPHGHRSGPWPPVPHCPPNTAFGAGATEPHGESSSAGETPHCPGSFDMGWAGGQPGPHSMWGPGSHGPHSGWSGPHAAWDGFGRHGGGRRRGKRNGDLCMSKRMARLVSHKNVEDGTKFAANTLFTKEWIVRNDSEQPWPPGPIRVVRAGGDALETGTAATSTVEQLAPGETATVSFGPMMAPSKPGLYKSYYRLETSVGQRIGQRLWCTIFSADNGPDCARTSAVQAPQLAQPV